MKKILLLSVACVLLVAGCLSPERLEVGGSYAPAVTNATGQVTATAAPDMALFVADSSYQLAYEAALTACRLEKANRALLRVQFPNLKKEMDRVREEIWRVDGDWAKARQAYLANPVPANLEPINRVIAEMQRWNATATTLLPQTP